MNYDLYPREAWLEVNLEQFQKNIKIIQQQAGRPTLVVVKSNAYGHGLIRCGLAAEQAGAAMLGVATAGEAAFLREAGVKIPILRMTAYGLREIESFVDQDIDFFVWTQEQISQANSCGKEKNKKARVHLQIDTGMGRDGVFLEQVEAMALEINKASYLDFIGVCSHFHSADFEDVSRTERQIEKFNKSLDILDKIKIRPRCVHLANSPGLLRFENARYDMVRSGVISYGLFYERGFNLPEGVHPIAEWKARLVSVKTLPPGHGVSYGVRYQTQTEEDIGIIPIGYADGFHRFPDNCNEVLLNGRRVSVVGRVCMDQCMVKIPSNMKAKIGDEVVLLGRQGNEYIDALDIADRWGTNNYDVLANIATRVPRIYSN